MKTSTSEITNQLLNHLWSSYLSRVSYAKEYARLVTEKGVMTILHSERLIPTQENSPRA